jgi:hypothetical protein
MIEIYNYSDTELKALEIDVPEWVDQDIASHQVASIIEGGCDSGAYMPAVEYFTAKEIMNKYGDDVCAYIDENSCGVDIEIDLTSWSNIAVKLLSTAVELWALNTEEAIIEAMEESPQTVWSGLTMDEDTTEPCPDCEDRSPMCHPECPWNNS